jgi:hypothetical protein
MAQHHVANVNGIGEGRVFGEFFERSCWIVVVHGIHSSADGTARLLRTALSARPRMKTLKPKLPVIAHALSTALTSKHTKGHQGKRGHSLAAAGIGVFYSLRRESVARGARSV